MIAADKIEEILAIYRKYNWMLRCVRLTEASSQELEGHKELLFGDAPVTEGAVDAAWFSRPPAAGGVAWELRYLGEMPFALLERIDEHEPEFENTLRELERRLCDTIAAKCKA